MEKKITIPEEYRTRFTGGAYLARWKDRSLLLLTESEYKNLLDTISALESAEMGLRRFLEAGIEEIKLEHYSFTLPEWALSYLKGAENIEFKIVEKRTILVKRTN